MILKEPTKTTLKKYGLSLAEWQVMADKQDSVCYVCQKLPKRGFLCVDHYHVFKWKKLLPEERKKYIRGLLCSYCNLRLLPKGLSLAKAKRIVSYLEEWEMKRPQ